MPLRLPLALLFLLQLLLSMPVHAGLLGIFDDEFDAEKKPWEELQAQLPVYPAIAQALPMEVASARPTLFFIDPKSIAVSEDGVVRYSLIAKSSSGVLNVSYEGIRCETREKKLYAFGRKDSAWSRNRFAKWEEIRPSRNPPQNVLFTDFFCPQRDIVNNTQEAISALERGIHPRAER